MTRVAFVGATLLDGTGSPPLADSAVVVDGGRISWVGQSADLGGNDVRLLDVAGKYLTPGLLDANVHLLLDSDPAVLLRYEPGCYDELVLEAAQVALRAGITTVFDTWGPLEALRRVRNRINEGTAVGSRVFCAGNIIGNGGPWSADFFPSYSESLNPVVVETINQHWEQGVGSELPWMSADDVRQVVREYIATSGIDFVKYASSAHGPKKFIALSPYAQRAIVEEAHAAGMTAQACATAPEALKLAIEAGVDLLQHGSSTGVHPMPQATLDVIVGEQIPCVALLYTERHAAAFAERPGRPEFVNEPARMAVRIANARELIGAGAKLMLATDGGVLGRMTMDGPLWSVLVSGLPDVPYQLGSSHIVWFKAALECGMEPMDALLAATRNIAEAYRRDDELGTVEPGKRADLLVLDANPLEDPDNYSRIAYVVKDGELVDRELLPEHPVLTGTAEPRLVS